MSCMAPSRRSSPVASTEYATFIGAVLYHAKDKLFVCPFGVHIRMTELRPPHSHVCAPCTATASDWERHKWKGLSPPDNHMQSV